MISGYAPRVGMPTPGITHRQDPFGAFTAQDGTALAQAHDAYHATLEALLASDDAISDRIIADGARYPQGRWRALQAARRARAELSRLRGEL